MSLVLLEEKNKVATITINRPDAMNALNQDVLLELRKQLLSISDSQVLVLRGAGEKAFVAGADIKQMVEMKPMEARAFAELGQGVIQLIEQLPLITIAAVHGFALGGGLELALSCDLIYSSDKAKFGAPETNLGIVPGFGGTVNLTKRIGFENAMNLILSGDMIDAQAALNLRLTSKIITENFFDEVTKVAEKLAVKGAYSSLSAKRLVRAAASNDNEKAFLLERESFGSLFGSGEPKEGMTAFIEKRKPKF